MVEKKNYTELELAYSIILIVHANVDTLKIRR
jgi:hypothetical protein